MCIKHDRCISLVPQRSGELQDDAELSAERKRMSESIRNSEAMPATARNCGHTTSRPAPRYRIACANETKWVEGDACMSIASQGGMLSRGVAFPDRMFKGTATSI